MKQSVASCKFELRLQQKIAQPFPRSPLGWAVEEDFARRQSMRKLLHSAIRCPVPWQFLPVLLSVVWVLMGSAAIAAAQSPIILAAQLRANSLCNFASFVEWPSSAFPEANAPILIGVAGDGPLASVMQSMVRGKTVNGRPLAAREVVGRGDLHGLQILFLSRWVGKQTPGLLESVRGASVLTVGEAQGFLDAGGIVRLTFDGSRSEFEIDIQAAERAGIRISSRLLAMAKVSGGDRPRGRE
jgi:hypothetical protein